MFIRGENQELEDLTYSYTVGPRMTSWNRVLPARGFFTVYDPDGVLDPAKGGDATLTQPTPCVHIEDGSQRWSGWCVVGPRPSDVVARFELYGQDFFNLRDEVVYPAYNVLNIVPPEEPVIEVDPGVTDIRHRIERRNDGEDIRAVLSVDGIGEDAEAAVFLRWRAGGGAWNFLGNRLLGEGFNTVIFEIDNIVEDTQYQVQASLGSSFSRAFSYQFIERAAAGGEPRPLLSVIPRSETDTSFTLVAVFGEGSDKAVPISATVTNLSTQTATRTSTATQVGIPFSGAAARTTYTYSVTASYGGDRDDITITGTVRTTAPPVQPPTPDPDPDPDPNPDPDPDPEPRTCAERGGELIGGRCVTGDELACVRRRRNGENVVWNPDTNTCDIVDTEEPQYRLIAFTAAPSTISVSLTGQISQVNTAYTGAVNLAQQVTIWLRPTTTQRAQRRTVRANAQGTFRTLWSSLEGETAYVTTAQGPDARRITRFVHYHY